MVYLGPMARPRRKPRAPSALVLADIPERNRLRELKALLGQRRDAIAELDLAIETLRDRLATFEASYRAQVADETSALERIERLVQHFERWTELLREAPPGSVARRARLIEARRDRELAEVAFRHAPLAPEDGPPLEAPDERLKVAFRALARRYHPDFAGTEDERVQLGDLMARINALYRDGDVERLEAMAEQAKGGEPDASDADLFEQVARLEERLRWFDQVLQNLEDERAALDRSPTCELWRAIEAAAARGRDRLLEIKQGIRARAEKSYALVASAARLLESEVKRFNRRNMTDGALTRRQSQALERRFDPFADKRLVRLGLEQLKSLKASPAARELAERLEGEGAARPTLLRLLLLTYVSELSPHPLPGLERFDDLDLRLRALAQRGEAPAALERALVDADAFVELGVKRPSAAAHLGLRFRSELARDAVLVMLQSLPIRREFKRVLGVLGERERCSTCRQDIFAVPLFRTRGLGDLRALVCPRCAKTLRSYWMPRGLDVQAVLNAAFLDFEIVTEWSFRLGRGSFGIQLLPLQVARMKVGELRRLVFDDLFRRYELEVEPEEVMLAQDGASVPDAERLGERKSATFVIQLSSQAKVREGEALEVLLHRVRNRFRA
jgi:hypothetical protein